MSGILLKFTWHAKIRENTTHNEKKSKWIESDPERTQKIDLVDKDIEHFQLYSIWPIGRCKIKHGTWDREDLKKHSNNI